MWSNSMCVILKKRIYIYGSVQQKRATERARCLFRVKGALFNSLITVCCVYEKKPSTYINRFFPALSNGAVVFIAKRFLPDENSSWILKAIFLKVYHVFFFQNKLHRWKVQLLSFKTLSWRSWRNKRFESNKMKNTAPRVRASPSRQCVRHV